MFQKKMLAGVLAVAALSGSAMAQTTILSFGFTDLNGSYTLLGSTFDASGQAISSGDVTRLQGGAATALYNPGTAVGRVNINLNVTGILGNTANGNGTLTISDSDAIADTMTATVSGQFIQNGSAVFFNGSLTNVFLNDNGAPDGQFNGPSGGSFPLSFAPNLPPFTGAVIQLYVGTPGNFFTGNFNGVSTQLSGQIVPAPATLGVLGLGLVGLRRRRR